MSAAHGRGSHYRSVRRQCLDGATHCTWCGDPISDDLPPDHPKKATADHVLPASEGGANVIENFVPACRDCNIRRGARDPSVLNHDVPGAEDW